MIRALVSLTMYYCCLIMTQIAHFMNDFDLGLTLTRYVVYYLYTYISTLMTTAVRGRLRPHSLLWPFYGLWSICKHLPFSESFGG